MPFRNRIRSLRLRARPPGQWSLRTRLVAAAVGLSGIALAVAGFAGVTLLRTYLMRQVDQQLHVGVGAGQRFSSDAAPPPRPVGQRFRELPNPLVFVVLDGRGRTQQRAGGLPSGTTTPDLRGLTLAAVRRHDGRAFTVASTDGSTEYRVRAEPLADGTGSIAVALSLRSVDQTVSRLRTITLISSGAVLGALVLVAVGAVSLGLRPLRAVERTAGRIAGGDLSHRVPPGPPGTEVGRLADAVNDMLSQIEASFTARSRRAMLCACPPVKWCKSEPYASGITILRSTSTPPHIM